MARQEDYDAEAVEAGIPVAEQRAEHRPEQQHRARPAHPPAPAEPGAPQTPVVFFPFNYSVAFVSGPADNLGTSCRRSTWTVRSTSRTLPSRRGTPSTIRDASPPWSCGCASPRPPPWSSPPAKWCARGPRPKTKVASPPGSTRASSR